MQLSHLFTAFALLAGTLLIGAAGIHAVDSAYAESQDRYDAANSDASTTDELEVGLDLSTSLSTLLPLFGFAMVPLGIIGLLVAVGWRSITSGNVGVARR